VSARAVAAIALSGALAVGLSGCVLWETPETQRAYDPSDGVSIDLGDLELHNVLVLTEDGELGNLVGTAVNTSKSDIDFTVQWSVDGSFHEVALTAHANGATRFGGEGAQLTLEPIAAQPGSLLDAVVHTQTGQKGAVLPVLDGGLAPYDTLLPTPTPTPTPSAAPADDADGADDADAASTSEQAEATADSAD